MMIAMMMFFVAWLFELPWYTGLGLMALGFVLELGCFMLGEIIEKVLKKLK